MLKKIIVMSLLIFSLSFASHKPTASAPKAHGAPPRPARPATVPGAAKAMAQAASSSVSLAMSGAQGAAGARYYQQSDRAGNERSGSAQAGTLTSLADIADGDDVEAQLLQRNKLSCNTIAQELASRFPHCFQSVSEIEKHVADLETNNPGLRNTLAGHVATLQNKGTATRGKGRKQHKQDTESSVDSAAEDAEKFLSEQMTRFLVQDRNTHASNANYYKKWTYGGTATTIATLLWYGYTHIWLPAHCK